MLPLLPPQGSPDDLSPSCLLSLGVTHDDLQFFTSSEGILHTNFEDLGLDSALFEFLSGLPLLHDQIPDRYVVYVDGSSQGAQQRRPLAWNDDGGISDGHACFGGMLP